MGRENCVLSHPYTETHIRVKAIGLCRGPHFAKSDFEDIQQDMWEYLLSHADDFDPARGSLPTFVACVIDSGIKQKIRHRKRQKRSGERFTLSLDQAFAPDSGQAAALSSSVSSRDVNRRTGHRSTCPIEQHDLEDLVSVALTNVGNRARAIMLHVRDHGVASASRKFDISRRKVDEIVRRMREELKDLGLF